MLSEKSIAGIVKEEVWKESNKGTKYCRIFLERAMIISLKRKTLQKLDKALIAKGDLAQSGKCNNLKTDLNAVSKKLPWIGSDASTENCPQEVIYEINAKLLHRRNNSK